MRNGPEATSNAFPKMMFLDQTSADLSDPLLF